MYSPHGGIVRRFLSLVLNEKTRNRPENKPTGIVIETKKYTNTRLFETTCTVYSLMNAL